MADHVQGPQEGGKQGSASTSQKPRLLTGLSSWRWQGAGRHEEHGATGANLTQVGACSAKSRVQPLVTTGKYLGHVKSSQLCGETSLHMWRVTRLQALPIGPDMKIYMAGDCRNFM